MAKSRFLGLIFLFALYLTTFISSSAANLATAQDYDPAAIESTFSVAENALLPSTGNLIPKTETTFSFLSYKKLVNPFYPESIAAHASAGSIKNNMLQPNSAIAFIHIIRDPLSIFNRTLRC